MKFGDLIKRHAIKIIVTISFIFIPLLILSVINSEARASVARFLFGPEASQAVIDNINWLITGVLGLGGLVTSSIAEEALFRCKRPEEASAEEITSVLAGKNLIEDVDTPRAVAGMSSSRSSLDSLTTQPEIFPETFKAVLITPRNSTLSSSFTIRAESEDAMQTSSYMNNEWHSSSGEEYACTSHSLSQNRLSGSS